MGRRRYKRLNFRFKIVAVFLLQNLFCFGQFTISAQGIGYVEYEYTKNLGVEYETIGILKFNSLESQFIELSPGYIAQVDTDNDDNIVATTYSENRPLFQIDLKSDTLFTRQTLFKKVYITKERIPIIDWKIEEKYKKIEKFECQLASGTFRGRTYKVWFTTDIPVKFGPWKLQGLPGLILEAIDDKNAIIFNAKKVVIGLKTEIDYFDTDDAMELKSYIELKENIYNEKEKNISAKLPRDGTFKLNMPGRKTQKEIIYEWEKTKKEED
jgi:GLPGLI family protein